MANYDAAPVATRQLQLSPATSYYLRKLLRQNFERLRDESNESNVETSSGLDPFADLNTLLTTIYTKPEALKDAIAAIEKAASYHQALSQQGSQYQQEQDKVERDLFELLGFKQGNNIEHGTILVVDDRPENVRILSKALTAQGYEVQSTSTSTMTLTAAKQYHPDLILLDIMMPFMDGYEVCRNLKRDEQTGDIPVIFISALSEVFDKVKAFEVGGIDYVTKPFQLEEVYARVGNQLKIRQWRQHLEAQNLRLQNQVQSVSDRSSRDELWYLSQQALDYMGDYVLFCDAQAQLIHITQPIEEFLGYTPTDLNAKSLSDLDPDAGAVWSQRWEKLHHDATLYIESSHQTKSGQTIAVATTYYLLRHAGKEYACIVANCLN